jgi:hypothetical protein
VLVNVYDERSLQFAVKVRAGMTPRVLGQLFDLLRPMEVEHAPSAICHQKEFSLETGFTAARSRDHSRAEGHQCRTANFNTQVHRRHRGTS